MERFAIVEEILGMLNSKQRDYKQKLKSAQMQIGAFLGMNSFGQHMRITRKVIGLFDDGVLSQVVLETW